MIEVCYCIDKNTETCGFTSLCSLLKHCKSNVIPNIILEEKNQKITSEWNNKLSKLGFNVDLRTHFVNNEFSQCRLAFNSSAPYLIFYVPLIAKTKKILYIDADTIITDDISELYSQNLNGKKIGLFRSGLCNSRSIQESKILKKYRNIDIDPYYGSMVALIDVESYLNSNRFQSIVNVAKKDPFNLMLWDQTLINCVFDVNEIYNLAEHCLRWNQDVPRLGSLPEYVPGLIHFTGTPKPWDMFGEFFHPCFKKWLSAANDAGFFLPHIKNYFSFSSYRRLYYARKQYSIWFKK